MSVKNPDKRDWDVIVIGTGMGGAVLGYALAKAGRNVLFCEKGESYLTSGTSLTADFAERFFLDQNTLFEDKNKILAHAGRWTGKIEDVSAKNRRAFVPFIGSGAGGSSALYGMAMERFFPADFAPRQNYPEARESTLPEVWPISYKELLPYYIAAERLFRVRGGSDPLRGNESFDHYLPLPHMSPASEELFDFFLGKGLHPYRLPMACEFRSGCECCQGYLCDKSCKNDSARICLMPSLAEYGADLIDECTVVKLECLRSEVTDIICYHRGRWLRLHGKIVVLAAGALETPRILLSSASTAWPNGLANGSGLVGRNLMRHYIDLYAIRAKTKLDFIPSLKELAFNDLYISGGQKLGTVQAFGALPPAEILVDGIQEEFRQGAFPIAASLFGAVKPAMRIFLKHLFHRRIILAGLMEDLPYSENMVALSNKTDEYGRRNIIIKYCISENERKRIEAFRKELSKILKPYHFVLIKQAENNERIAHACGTCRFGTDPKESVLDPYNRAHGLSNLYVVDSSFFPSSGGTNPALTIAANALRVAAHLISIGRG